MAREGQAAGSLLCLAPHGVFRASPVARRAVGFYPAFSPLPRTTCAARGGLFSVTLSVAASLGPRLPRILRGMVPEGVRTFLQPGEPGRRSSATPQLGKVSSRGALHKSSVAV